MLKFLLLLFVFWVFLPVIVAHVCNACNLSIWKGKAKNLRPARTLSQTNNKIEEARG